MDHHFTIQSPFGKIALTPSQKDALYLQTFWPIRPLKVGDLRVFVSLALRRSNDGKAWELCSGFHCMDHIEEAKGNGSSSRDVNPQTRKRVLAALLPLAANFAAGNPAVFERAEREHSLWLAKHFDLSRLVEKLEDASRCFVVRAEDAAREDQAVLLDAARITRRLRSMMPRVEKIVEKLTSTSAAAA
jgi:hypothetical protein